MRQFILDLDSSIFPLLYFSLNYISIFINSDIFVNIDNFAISINYLFLHSLFASSIFNCFGNNLLACFSIYSFFFSY